MHVYCLFCQTQRAKRIAELLKNRGWGQAFTPMIICRHRVQGKLLDKPYDLLPGYVFLFTEEPVMDFSDFRKINGVGHLLGRREEQFEITGSDREFALSLLKVNGLVNPMTLVHEGGKVKLLNPLFEYSHGVITEIEYKKQRAKVEFLFAEERWITWVAVNELLL